MPRSKHPQDNYPHFGHLNNAGVMTICGIYLYIFTKELCLNRNTNKMFNCSLIHQKRMLQTRQVRDSDIR